MNRIIKEFNFYFKDYFYISFFFLIFFLVPNFIEIKFFDNFFNFKLKYLILFSFSVYYLKSFFTNEKIKDYVKKNILYIYLIFITIYLSSFLYYYLIVANNDFNGSFHFEEKFIFSFIYQFSLVNLLIFISINFNHNIFYVFNKILFYFSSLMIFEFVLIKLLFFLNYNGLTFNINFYDIFMHSNPIVYYDHFFSQGRIYRSLFINDHLITSFIFFIGFLTNLYFYENNKKKFHLVLSIICLVLSYYNLESRLTILTNSLMLLLFISWIITSRIKLNYLLLLIILGFYSFIFFTKLSCGLINVDTNFINSLCKIDSLYDRFSLAFFSLGTWLQNPLSFGLELLNNFYTLNTTDLFLNNNLTSGDSYVTVTALRGGKYGPFHGGEITHAHNFFISSLGNLGMIFPILLYIFFKKINFKSSNLNHKYIFMILTYSILNCLINKIYFIEVYVFLTATFLVLYKDNAKI